MADDERAAAMAELTQAIAHDILTLSELGDPDWDTYAVAAEVGDARVGLTAFRYAGSGAPIPTAEPEDSFAFLQLREATRGVDGAAWDVVLVKVRRDTADLVMTFLSGADAEPWRVRPQNMPHLPEALRPSPDDFESRET